MRLLIVVRSVVVLTTLSLALTACSGESGDTTAGDSVATSAAGDTAASDAAEPAPAANEGSAATEAIAATEETSNPKDEAGLDLPAPTPGLDQQTPPAEPVAPEGPTAPPTEGLPGGRYVQIDDITAVGQGYAALFTPFNFEPLIGSGPQDFHVHFFWNDVAPENAGTNGPTPASWELYDGPSPFEGLTFATRPPAATQMCALVADANHGVTVGSGNCVTLP